MVMLRTLLKLIYVTARQKQIDKQLRANRNKITRLSIESLYLEREIESLLSVSDAYDNQVGALKTALKDFKNAGI